MRKDRDDEDYEPQMPPVEGGEYLLGVLWDVGPMMSGSMGSAPITHEELQAWSFLTGIGLRPWEVRWLRQLSREYVNELHAAEKRDRKAPWKDMEPDRVGVAKGLQAAIAGLSEL